MSTCYMLEGTWDSIPTRKYCKYDTIKSKTYEPYIRISTGDYEELLRKRGQDNALVAILRSISHELTQYF